MMFEAKATSIASAALAGLLGVALMAPAHAQTANGEFDAAHQRRVQPRMMQQQSMPQRQNQAFASERTAQHRYTRSRAVNAREDGRRLNEREQIGTYGRDRDAREQVGTYGRDRDAREQVGTYGRDRDAAGGRIVGYVQPTGPAWGQNGYYYGPGWNGAYNNYPASPAPESYYGYYNAPPDPVSGVVGGALGVADTATFGLFGPPPAYPDGYRAPYPYRGY